MERSGTNKIRVDIHGNQYTLRGSESVDHMKQVAKTVDELMRALSMSHTYLDAKRVAVLTAVNLANDLLLLQKQYDELVALLDERTKSPPR